MSSLRAPIVALPPQAEAALNQARGLRTLAGPAAAVEAREHDVIVTIAYGDERERVAYDAVVVAIGFDGRWFETLLGEEASGRSRTRSMAPNWSR